MKLHIENPAICGHEARHRMAAVLDLEDDQQFPARNRLIQYFTGFEAAAISIAATELGFSYSPSPDCESITSAIKLGINELSAGVLMNDLSGAGFVEKGEQCYTIASDTGDTRVFETRCPIPITAFAGCLSTRRQGIWNPTMRLSG